MFFGWGKGGAWGTQQQRPQSVCEPSIIIITTNNIRHDMGRACACA